MPMGKDIVSGFVNESGIKQSFDSEESSLSVDYEGILSLREQPE